MWLRKTQFQISQKYSIFCRWFNSRIFCLFLLYCKRLVTGSYNIEHSKIIEINSSLFEGIISNVLSFYRMFSTILNGDNYLIYYSLFFALIISLIVIVLKVIKRDENKKTKFLLVVLILLASMFSSLDQ